MDYSTEPMTLVEFRLAEMPNGTRLTVVESGVEPGHLDVARSYLDQISIQWDKALDRLKRFVEE